eukprot:4946380-Alexandrium_andersonii.AAC.1
MCIRDRCVRARAACCTSVSCCLCVRCQCVVRALRKGEQGAGRTTLRLDLALGMPAARHDHPNRRRPQ